MCLILLAQGTARVVENYIVHNMPVSGVLHMYLHGGTCTCMEAHVLAWRHMYLHGGTCTCMYLHGGTCTCMEAHVLAWRHMYLHGGTCTCMEARVLAWRHMYLPVKHSGSDLFVMCPLKSVYVQGVVYI